MSVPIHQQLSPSGEFQVIGALPMYSQSGLEIINTHVNRVASLRFEQAMQYGVVPVTKQERAVKLQTMLALMKQEERFVKLCYREVEAAFCAQRAYDHYLIDSVETVRTNCLMESTIFHCPERIDDPEELACWLRLPELMEISKECVTQIINKSSLPWREKFCHLARFFKGFEHQLKTSPPKWMWIVKKAKAFIEKEIATGMLIVCQVESIRFKFETANFLPKERKRWLEVEDLVSPYGSLLLFTTSHFLQNTIQKKMQGVVDQHLDIPYYTFKQRICRSYQEHRPQQEALYQVIYQNLKTLTLENRGIEWVKYLKDVGPCVGPEIVFNDNLNPFVAPVCNPIQEFLKRFLRDEQEEQIPAPVQERSPTPKQKLKDKAKPTRKKKTQQQVTASAIPQEISPLQVVEKAAESPQMTTDELFAKAASCQLLPTPQQMPPPPKFPYPYAFRVMRWFKVPPEGPLDPENFWDYPPMSPDQDRWTVAIHSFSMAVDPFYHIGIKTNWKNRKTGHQDTLYVIPADLHDSDKRKRGFITYCVGQDGVCYHRGFSDWTQTSKLNDADYVKKIASKAFHDNDFPELQSAKFREESVKPVSSAYSAEAVTVHPQLGTVELKDQRLQITLRLYKTSTSTSTSNC